MRSAFILSSVLFAAACQAANLTSMSQANCYSEAPVINQSSSAPVASSIANCSEMFSFSNSVASSSGAASYGSLAVMGYATDKDISTSNQSSVSFSDTLHLFGQNPNSISNDVEVQFVVQIIGNLLPESATPFPTQSFSASFTGGAPPVSVSMSCNFDCVPFEQTYLVTQEDPGAGPVSFSALLTGAGAGLSGAATENASLQLLSINLLDPMTGDPLSGFQYSTDSGATYSIAAAFIPEPGSCVLVSLGAIAIVLGYAKKRR